MKKNVTYLAVAALLGFATPVLSATCELTLDGYASVSGDGITTTTGGAGGTETTVTTLADLETWVSDREKNTTAGILYISGQITSSTSTVLTIKNGANISILGINGGELQNIGLNIRDYSNVIVQNLKLHEVLYPNDALTLDNVNHGWVNHCELYSTIGTGITYDTYDGLLDVKNGSKYITISWCRLHDHMKVMLFGHTDNASSQATDELLRVTLHHNFIYNTDGRNPSLRWGAVHSYNNYFKGVTDYGAAVRRYAHMLLESNVYVNVKTPITTDNFIVDEGDDGIVCERDCSYTGCGDNSITATDCDWWTSTTLPYSYTLTSTASLASSLEQEAGVCGETHASLPYVTITAPATNATFATGSSITFTATATEAGGTISSVVFYYKSEDEYTTISTSTSSPYTCTWSGASAGTYTVFANAYDASGNFAVSNCVVVVVSSTVTAPTLTDPSNKTQTINTGSAIDDIVFTWGGSATDVTVTGLPDGLTATKNTATKTLTISGTPAAGGTYSVTTSGGTSTVSVSGTITLATDVPTLTDPSNKSQGVTPGTAIDTIVFTWGGSATDVTITGLPAGLTATKDTAARTLTITGVPSASGSYTVTTLGGTGSKSISGTITTSCNTVLADWYNFQESTLSLSFASYANATLTPSFSATSYTSAGCTDGALVMTKTTGVMTLTLNSLATLKFRYGATGSRSIVVNYGTTGTENTWTSSTYAAGAYEIDLTSLVSGLVSTSPIVVNIVNNGSGNLNITDLYVEGSITSCDESLASQALNLEAGWNLISFNVSPADKSIASVFSSVMGSLVEVKTLDAFWRGGQAEAYNSLDSIADGAAYLVYMGAAGTLTLQGTAIASFETTLKAGWNMVGVPSPSGKDVATLLAGTQVTLVKSLGLFWLPSATSTLTNLEVGKGYFMYCAGATTLGF